MIKPKKISGFNELLPEEELIQQYLLKIIKDEFNLNAFLPIETASVETNEVLQAKEGIETKEIYQLTKLSDNTDVKDFSLRFDLTLPLARYVSQNYGQLIFPFKRYQIQKVWRGERPAKGRFREFYQADIDIIGENTLSKTYDAEIVTIINNIFTKFNIGDFNIKVNNRKLQLGLFEELSIPSKEKVKSFSDAIENDIDISKYITDRRDEKTYKSFKLMKRDQIEQSFIELERGKVIKVLDDIDKLSKEKIKENLISLSVSEKDIDILMSFVSLSNNIDDIAAFSKNKTYQEGIFEIKEFINDLSMLGMNLSNLKLDTSIARGLGYYTGMIFETELTDIQEAGSICSGGRYDNLTKDYSKINLPGVGMSIGLSRLISIILDKKIIPLPPQRNADFLILTSLDKEKMINITKEIREMGIPCELSFFNNYKKEIKYALRKNYRFILLSERNSDSFILRDLYEEDRSISDKVMPKEFLLMLLSNQSL